MWSTGRPIAGDDHPLRRQSCVRPREASEAEEDKQHQDASPRQGDSPAAGKQTRRLRILLVRAPSGPRRREVARERRERHDEVATVKK
jgi:hypothetical protein